MQDEQDNVNMDAPDVSPRAIGCIADTQMLDWLQEQTKGYGLGWIVRNSHNGRGMRLHETSQQGAKPTVREAIIDAMNKE